MKIPLSTAVKITPCTDIYRRSTITKVSHGTVANTCVYFLLVSHRIAFCPPLDIHIICMKTLVHMLCEEILLIIKTVMSAQLAISLDIEN